MPAGFDCPSCKKRLDVRRMALATMAFNPAMHLHVTRCPECQESFEFRAMSGALDIGYTYWAGSMHFETMARLPLRGFRRGTTDGSLELDGVQIFAPGV